MAGRSQKFSKQAAVLAAQASAGRKPQEGVREANGRLSRSARKMLEEEPNQIARLRAAALAGVADKRWGTQLGRLFLERKITPEQYGAGSNWAALIERWRAVHCGPRFNPKAGLSNLQRVSGGGASIGDDFADRNDELVADMVDKAIGSFARGAADPALIAVRDCVEQDIAPVGFGGKSLLDEGLSHLVEHWGLDG